MYAHEKRGVPKIPLLLIIALFGLSIFYLWSNASRSELEVKVIPVTGTVQETGKNNPEANINASAQAVKPTAKTVQQNKIGGAYTLSSVKILLFLDKNYNGIKDGNESGCDVCVAKQVLAGIWDKESHLLPDSTQIKQGSVTGAGNVSTANLDNSNYIWGAYDDRKALIPNVDLTSLQQTDTLQVPVFPVSGSVGGINAAIAKSFLKDREAYYVFTQIVPPLQNSLDSGQDIWVQYTPDNSKSDIYYLASGKMQPDNTGNITGMAGSYYLSILWNFSATNVKVLNKENLRFFFFN